MGFDLDTAIFISFLCINLAIGIFFSKGAISAREYALGDRNFSTSAITTTVIATCIGAGFFSASITESYRQGLYFIIPAFGEPIALIVTGYFLIPRMVEFFGNMSVAETMGKIYGKNVRLVSAIAGTLIATGIVALQFKVASSILQLFFGMSSIYAVALSAAIVVAYSSFGGIKAVTYTDIIQFFTFGVILPLITISVWKPALGDPTEILHKISQTPVFNIKEVFEISNPRFLTSLFLLLFFIIPNCDVTYIQRIGMSKGVDQARKSFIIAGCVVIILLLITCWTGVLLFCNDPTLEPNNLLPHIIESYTYTGLKGLTAICIMSIIMSTADSYLNSASVLLTNDIIKVIKPDFISIGKELLLLRLVALCVGIGAFFLACEAGSLFELLLLTFGFYMPVVTVPLILAIFGFRTNSKVILIGMMAGAATVVLWSMDTANAAVWSRFVGNVEAAKVSKKMFIEINPVIPAMLVNLIATITAHFILGRPTGNINSDHVDALAAISRDRSRKFQIVTNTIKKFNFIEFCKNNQPKNNSGYMLLGLFSLASAFSTMYTVSTSMYANYSDLLNIIYHSVLIISFVLLSHPLWSQKIKGKSFLAVFWMLAAPYILIFAPMLLVLISQASQFQLIIFLVNILILALVMRWQVYLCMVVVTTIISVEFFKWFADASHITIDYLGAEFKIMYIILLVSSTIIAFLKPRQESAELAEAKIDDMAHKLDDQKNELYKALELKYEFLRNLQHESRTPLTGITSMAEALNAAYDNLSEERRKQAIEDIASNAERLESYVNNLIDLSNLSNMKYNLNLQMINLSDLVCEKLDKIRRLYIIKAMEDLRDFSIKIEPGIITECDEYYIGRTIENIIINAIKYCKQGKIEINLSKTNNIISFSIEDQGIGIPKEDLRSIFGAFTTSSKTKTPAGGRGVGLALAKTVIDLHKGNITAESDGSSWTKVTFTLAAS